MPDLIHLAIPAFLLLMILEAVAGAVMQREIYEAKDAASSITMGLGNLASDLLAKVVEFSVLRPSALRDFSHWLRVVGLGAALFRRRIQLLLVSLREPRLPALVGFARSASLERAL